MVKTEKIPAANPAALLKSIKASYQRYTELGDDLRKLKSLLFVDTYLWCEAIVALGKLKTVSEAKANLAKSVGASRHAVSSWYETGKYMRRHSINPEKVDANAVRAAAWHKASLSKAGSLKILSALKKGGKLTEVNHLIHTDHRISGHDEVRH